MGLGEWYEIATEWMSANQVLAGTRALVYVVAGFLLARLARAVATRLVSEHLSSHQAMLMRRGIYYLVLSLFVISALRELGFSLGVLLGAAGVLSVAVGFASQTSASNLISGLFLVGEKPFEVGDLITVGDKTGEVLSIDLLSTKLRTFDNLYVRIPNETIIKNVVTTMTRFPIRRLDVKLGVAYKEDVGRVREVLMRVADGNPLCLEEPAPLFIFLGFGNSSLDIQFSVWAARANFLELRNTIQEAIKRTFDEEGIEIPFPHQTLYTGSATAPFPIRIVEPGADDPDLQKA